MLDEFFDIAFGFFKEFRRFSFGRVGLFDSFLDQVADPALFFRVQHRERYSLQIAKAEKRIDTTRAPLLNQLFAR